MKFKNVFILLFISFLIVFPKNNSLASPISDTGALFPSSYTDPSNWDPFPYHLYANDFTFSGNEPGNSFAHILLGSFDISASSTIDGIIVTAGDYHTTYGALMETIAVKLSWDGGSTYTGYKFFDTPTANDNIDTVGSYNDNWGHIWTTTELSDSNFVVFLELSGINVPDFDAIVFDYISIQVFYTISEINLSLVLIFMVTLSTTTIFTKKKDS